MAGRRSTSLPADFTVRHEIPEGMTVSLQGLEKLVVRFFGTEMKKRAGIEVFDEEKFWKERAERAAKPE